MRNPALATILIICILCTSFYLLDGTRQQWSHPSISSSDSSRLGGLSVASRIYVVNLPHRTDRKLQMERLRYALGLHFSYIDAVYFKSSIVETILSKVRELRIDYDIPLDESHDKPSRPLIHAKFAWPQDVRSFSPLGKDGSDFWEDSISPNIASDLRRVPLTSAYKDFSIDPYTPSLPLYRILTPGRIACWYSHLIAIRQIANGSGNATRLDDVSIVLEDDVDMEIDIRERLLGLWEGLPQDWDILFLGHCWSDESHHPALKVYNASLSSSKYSLTTLHPSLSPKCTHGYALTTRGARRLARLLRYPPFAFSRPLDQAMAWLVKNGKLKSYSIVPSIIVQRKVDDSDIVGGSGSGWKDELDRGVFT